METILPLYQDYLAAQDEADALLQKVAATVVEALEALADADDDALDTLLDELDYEEDETCEDAEEEIEASEDAEDEIEEEYYDLYDEDGVYVGQVAASNVE